MLVYPSLLPSNKTSRAYILYPKEQRISQSAIIGRECFLFPFIHLITLDNEPNGLQRFDNELHDSIVPISKMIEKGSLRSLPWYSDLPISSTSFAWVSVFHGSAAGFVVCLVLAECCRCPANASLVHILLALQHQPYPRALVASSAGSAFSFH